MPVRILIGDALAQLADLPSASVHCVVTSPPYWGLRTYGGDPGMIGLEPTFDEHLENLVAVFREVRRVLRKDGTLWLNYGDAYASAPNGRSAADTKAAGSDDRTFRDKPINNVQGVWKPKDLLMMPARVAMALQADGWWLRSEIVWHKPNPMPESCRDRPTSSHEKLFLLSRSAKYFYDAEAVRTPANHPVNAASPCPESPDFGPSVKAQDRPYVSGANLRNVWTIATHSFKEAHFATFPPALVEPCIKAGTSERGVCGECGAPWGRKTDISYGKSSAHGAGSITGRRDDGDGMSHYHGSPRVAKNVETTGWRPTCDHDAAPVPATVLDPFGGSGTVGLVADRLQRSAILIEISPDYAEMARRRIDDDAPLLMAAAE